MTSIEGDANLYPRLVPAGDSAVVIELGAKIDPLINDQVYVLARSIENAKIEAISELVPTYRSVLVNYDPLIMRFSEISERLDKLIGDSSTPTAAETKDTKVIELSVVYGGDDGPDIDAVADHAGLSVQEVINIHSGVDYRVYMIGFSPGFPYLGGLDDRIAIPRLKTPRISVPAGSVGIAESQTGVYPNASPGGWQLIGRIAAKLFDEASPRPSLITPGSKVRFVPVKSHD
ncbi:MAG: 5-oxoprolinase subunit PxpB [Chloroflexi bacterium]|nr:5-oxoprolinase subunit PxpB [Chloroflexota bacterium]